MLVPLSRGGSPGCQEALQINAPARGRGAGQTRDKGSVRQKTGFQAPLEKTFPGSTPAPCESPLASGMMMPDPGEKEVKRMDDISEWLENPYWKKYYEEAPSGACREYIALEFRYSDTEDEGIAEAMDALLETLRAEDLRHLAAYAGNNPQRTALLRRAEEMEKK